MPNATPDTAPMTLLRGAELVLPHGITDQGDVLLVGDRIAAVGGDLGAAVALGPVEVDASGHRAIPAFVDQHCHPIGGGGGGGPETQGFPIPVERFVEAGVGTVVGCLGNDSVVRRPEALLARVKGLRRHGFGAHLYTGEIGYPPETVTGSIRRDLALLDEVRGVKAAVGGIGSITTRHQLAALAGEAARGARTAGRAPVLHLHVEPALTSIALVGRAISRGDVDPTTVTVTHVNWNEAVLAEGIHLAGLGVNLDVTACIRPDYFPGAIAPEQAIRRLLDEVDPDRVTISSDAGGNHGIGDGTLLTHQPGLLLDTFVRALETDLVPVEQLVRVFSANPAARLGLADAGALTAGARADVLLMDRSSHRLEQFYLAGRRVLDAGTALVSDQAANERPDRNR
ncbi:hypothetical protein EFK50_08755 [Nocardioides marmoriginsengisoli]|uniref:Amidohydrolase-related domain-containing protein n=1 Tax=Nocardioides marmoriginsengisoli TaxID=661483 RepID=A0A3N0CFA8_9ACTN|nr:amidohydrolase family protein [Nocardioides marmoriginsengisoli]RNL61911.1 hypothetical protein EFK50_08755 [Nocardioides marmoriginsengisoli]